MDWLKSLLAKFVGPSLVGQIVRGLVKVVSGYLLTVGVEAAVIDNFTDSLIQIVSAIVIFIMAQKGSAVATKTALETPVIVKD